MKASLQLVRLLLRKNGLRASSEEEQQIMATLNRIDEGLERLSDIELEAVEPFLLLEER